MELSIITVAFRSKDKLRGTIEAVLKSKTDFSYEMIVVDNGSGDGTSDMVENEFVGKYSQIKLIRNKNNGFARGNNLGVLNSTGRVILFLNPDTSVGEDTLAECLKYLDAHPDIGALGVKLLFENGKMDKACRRSFPDPWNSFFRFSGLAKLFSNRKLFSTYNLTFLSEDQSIDVDSLSGAFMMVPRLVYEKVDRFDEDYFMYGEDIDFCYKVKQAGFRVYYYAKQTTYHYKGQSSRKTPYLALYWFHNSMVLFYSKHYRKKYPFFMNWLVYLAIWGRFYLLLIINSFRKNKFVSKNV